MEKANICFLPPSVTKSGTRHEKGKYVLIAGLVVSMFTFVFCSFDFMVRQHQPDEVLQERTKRCSFPVKEHQLLGRK